jgi:hypothetical protein
MNDRDISAHKMLETAGILEMKMAHDDSFSIFNIMTCGLDGVGACTLPYKLCEETKMAY